ncbi:MAG: right-handed parallel beta-helix repeat-containing protein [Pseudonocardia sp.]
MSEVITLRPYAAPEPPPPPRSWIPRGRALIVAAVGALVVVLGGIGTTVLLLAGETFTVTSAADATDAAPGDGSCATAAGTCTLRAAVQEANALAGPQSIGLPAGTYEIAIAPLNLNGAENGDLDVTGPLAIVGAGASATVVDGGNPAPGSPPNERGLDRLFEIHEGAGDVTFRNLTIREGFSDESGGAIQFGTPNPAPVPGAVVPAGVLTLDGVTVRDSYGTKSGGGLNNEGRGRVVVTGSTFSGNATGGSGAAINNQTTGTVEVIGNSQIVDNPGLYVPDPQHDPASPDPAELVPAPGVYEAGGGALANEAEAGAVGTLRVIGSTVARNTAGASGAGIANNGDGVVVVENATLTANRSEADGGALYAASGTITVSGSTFTGNLAGDGAGAYFGGELTGVGLRPRVTITGGSFTGNVAEAGGGGIASGGDGQLTVTGVLFQGNDAGTSGGALASGGLATLTLSGGRITGNTAAEAGGGILAESGRTTSVRDVEISANTALGEPEPELPGVPGDSDGGGGAYVDGAGESSFVNVRLLDNTASGDGGGIAFHGLGRSVLSDSVVRGNKTVCEECSGGGIEEGGSAALVERVLVERNTATANGGGIHNASSGELTIVDTTMQRNTAAAGGGFANQSDSTLAMRGSLIFANRATTGGEENSGLGGGIVSISDGGGVVENTTISGNTATVGGGGMFHDADAGMKLINVTVWGNAAPSGGAIGVVESDFVPSVPPQANPGLIARNSIVGGSTAGGTCDAHISTQGGNLDTANTCFLELNPDSSAPIALKDRRNVRMSLDALADNGGPTLTHAVPENSPAIDGGIRSLANADGSSQLVCPDTDQRGTARPIHLACDSGAYEYDGPAPAADFDAPETVYGSGPVQNSLQTVIFTFSGTDVNTTGPPTAPEDLGFECRLLADDPTDPLVLALREIPPGAALPPELRFNGCSSPWQIPLTEEGNFIFQVRAIDRAGNVDQTPAEHRFNGLDITPPDTVITERPPAVSSGRAATFSFVANDNLTPSQFHEFECRLDSRDPEAWVECFNPFSTGDLTTGMHTFEVRAYDTAENVDPSPARVTWEVGSPTNCDEANITLRPTGDAWVDEAVAGQNSSFTEFLTVRSTEAPGEAARALVQFALPTDTSSCTLQRAVLRLNGEGDAGRTITAQPLDRQWLANTVTWQSQPGVVGPVAQAPSPAGEAFIELDVTEAVNAMLAGATPNNGFRIADLLEVDPAGGGEQSFASSEAPFAPPEDPDPAPQLVLLYNPSDAPPPPPPTDPAAGELTTVFCGQVITVSTWVANDLTDCAGEGLVIGAPNIVLDLDGHTIDGPDYLTTNLSGQEGGFPAGIRNGGHDNVVIRNGTVAQFGVGVHLLAGTARNVVSNLTIQTNATAGVELLDADDGRNGNTIENSRIRDNELGVHVFTGSDNSRIVGSEITGNLGQAILLAQSRGTLVENNTIHGIPTNPALDSDGGFGLEGASGSVIRGNTIRDTGDAGLVLSAGSNDNVIENNVMFRNGDAGVSVGDSRGNRIAGNTAHQESDGGVVLNNAPNTVVVDNDLRFNPHGVAAGGVDNLVLERNDGSDSGADGFAISSGVNLRVIGNTAHRTGGSGIGIEASAFDANGNPDRPALIEGNRTDQNLAEGISVAAGGHLIRANEAYNNAGTGISVEGNVDGGGNLASGNGGIADCIGVVCGAGTAPPVVPADTTAPDTLITASPGPAGGTTARFEFTSEDGPAGTPVTAMRFECRLDPGPDPVLAPDPVELPDVPDPNNPQAPEPVEPNTPPDGAGWEECISPVTYTLIEPGEHRFEVRALDQADLRDLSPAVHTWVVEVASGADGPDTVAPNTTIRQFPPVETVSTDARFVFSGSDNVTFGPDLVLECALDGAPFAVCTSPQDYTGLPLGLHRFEVRATDRTGNVDASPAVREWTIVEAPPDVTAPETTIVSGPDATTLQTTATFAFTASEPGAGFECFLDSAPVTCAGGTRQLDNLAVGEHTFTVAAVDAAGNIDPTPAVYTWRVGDPIVAAAVGCGQVVTVSTRVTNDLIGCLGDGIVIGASGITVDLTDRTVTGTGQGAGVSTRGFDDVTIIGGAFGEFDAGVELSEGSVRGIVDGVDVNGNQVAGILLTDADQAIVRGVTVTGNDAGVVLQKGTSGAVVRDSTIGANSGSGVLVERSDGNRVANNLIAGSSDPGVTIGGARNNVVTGNTLDENSGGVAVGLNELTTLLIVQRPPDPNVPEPPPPGPVTTGLPSSDNTVSDNTITDSREAGLLVEGAQGATSVRNTLVDNTVGGSNGAGAELHYASDNTVLRNDLSGNKTGIEMIAASRNRIESNDASRSDGVGISLQALSLGNDLVLNTSSSNSGNGIYVGDAAGAGSGNVLDRNTANNNGSTGIAVTDILHVLVGNTAHDNGNWGIDVKPGNVDRGGNRAAGNVSPPQCANIRCDGGDGVADVIPPETLVLSGPADPTAARTASFRFSGSDNAGTVTFECRVDGVGPMGWVPCETGFAVSGLAVGAHLFEVRAVDESDNVDLTPAFHAWTIEQAPSGVAPDTTLVSTPDATTSTTTATFAFTANEPVALFECSLDGAAFTACASQSRQVYTGLAVGPHTFAVRAVDVENLRDPSPATFGWNVTAVPALTEVSCGEILTQSVMLANDLIDCEGTALVIGADGITVDLGGRVVDGTGLGAGILNPRHQRVAVTNGTISEFEHGVEFGPGAGRGALSALQLSGNAVAGVLLADADDAGAGNTVRDSQLTGNAVGVLVGPGTRGTLVRDNFFTANTDSAVRLELAGGARIENNTITGSGGPGIALERAADNVVIGNTVSDNTGGGIAGGAEALPSDRNRVEANTLDGNGFGILVTDSSATVVADNTVRGSGGAGIGLELADANEVTGNQLAGNASGIAVNESSGNRIQANDAGGSLGAGIELGPLALDNVVVLNAALGNNGAGITIEDLAPAGRGNSLDRNTANDNGGDGIYVGQSGHLIAGNRAVNNGGWGIYVELGNVDGGNNTAAGNIEAAQCFNITCAIGEAPGAPDTRLLTFPPLTTDSRYAAFTFIGSDDTTDLAAIVYQCRLDSAAEEAFVDCEYPQEYFNILPGSHTFEVRAVDAEQRVDPTPALYTWTYTPPAAGVAPDTVIDERPPAESPILEGIFTFTSTEPDAAFECRVDPAPNQPETGWQVCSDPEITPALGYGFFEYAFEELQLGRYAFEVRSIDIEGLRDPTPARYEWTISGGPLTTILSGPADQPLEPLEPLTGGETTATTARFVYDSANEPNSTFACSLDFAEFVDCNTPAGGGQPPTVKAVEYSNLLEGEHILRIVATDPLGREEFAPAVYEWEILPPTVTAPPETTITIAPVTGTSDLTFAFTGTDDNTPASRLMFECRVDGEPQNQLDFEPCLSPFNLLERYAITDPQLAPNVPHTFEVRAIDETEPTPMVDPTPAAHTWTPAPDTVAPQTAITARPALRTGDPNAAFQFVGSDNQTPLVGLSALAFECALDGAPFAPCTTPTSLTVEPGAHTFAVRAVDVAGNPDATPATYAWTVVGPPVTTVTGPASPHLDSIATITFTADQPGSTFECLLPGAAWSACTSPLNATGLSGFTRIEVRATNPERVLEDPAAFVEFTVVDSTPPDTTINFGPGTLTPAGTFARAIGGFTFASTEPGSTFECALDGAPFASCTSPHEVPGLVDGPHTFAVRALDPSGNPDPSPATREFTVDLPPTTEILTGPAELTALTTATFTYTSNEEGSTFECLVNTNGVSTDPVPCDSGTFTYTAAGPGDYLFAVRATDPQGNRAPLYALYEWTVGLGVEITQSPQATTTDTTATFAFVANDPDPRVRYQCALDGASLTLCTSPVTYPDLPAGTHTFEVQAVKAGMLGDPVPVSFTWTIIDETPPETTLASGPPATSDSATAVIGFTTNERNTTFECSFDGAAFVGCASPVTFDGLALGDHTFAVRAIDSAGNVDASPAEIAWEVVPDTTAPNTAITSGPPVVRADIEAIFTFTGADTGTPADQLVFECVLDGLPAEACDVPHEISDLTRGQHTLQVTAIDLAGNRDPSPATYTWSVAGEINTLPGANVLVDVTTSVGVVPEVSAELTFTSVTVAGATTIDPLTGFTPEVPTPAYQVGAQYYDIGTTATYSGLVTVCVEFDPASVSNPLAVRLLHFENGAWVDVTSPPSELASGIVCGRTASLSPFAIAVTNDPNPDKAPDTRFLAGPPATTVNFAYTVQFTGTDDLTDPLELEFECALDGGAFESCSSPHDVEVETAGPHTLAVRALDSNLTPDPTPAVRAWTVVDLTPPDTAIETGPESPTPDTFADFTFRAEFVQPTDAVGVTFACAVNGGDFVPCTSDPDAVPPVPYRVNGLVDAGAQVFLVRAVDAAGNADPTPDLYEWEILAPVDGTPPDTTVLAGPGPVEPVETVNEPPVLVFTSNQAGVEFECRLNGGAWESCESPNEYTGLVEGAYTADVRALRTFVDATGADVTVVDATPATHSWTVAAPPDTTLTVVPPVPVSGTTATFEFTSTKPNSTFTCTIDGAEPIPCTSPHLVRDLTEIDNPHVFEVFATDPLGAIDLTPATHTFVQGLPPDTTIIRTTDVPDPLDPTVVTLRIEFAGADETTPTLELEFECRLDGGTWSGCGPTLEEFVYNELPPGPHVFEVRAVDLGESPDPTPARHEFFVAQAPDTAIDLTAAGTPTAQTESTSATFTFSSGQADVAFQCSLDQAPEPVFTPCTSPASFTGLAAGMHEFVVRAVGPTGVLDPEPAVFEWEIGTLTAPTLTSVAGPPASALATSATFEWVSGDPALSYSCALDGAAALPCASPFVLENLRATPHTLVVSGARVGLIAEPEPLLYEWTVLDEAPAETVLVTEPAAVVPDTGTATVAFTGTDNGTPAEQLTFGCSLDGAVEFTACTSPATFAGLPVGQHTLAVRAVDAGGRADPTPLSVTWLVSDTTAPETTLLASPPVTTSDTTAVFDFSANEQGAVFSCAVDGQVVDPCVPPVQLNNVAVGQHTFSVSARDAAGNVDASSEVITWTVEPPPDVTPPNVTLTSAPSTSGSSATNASFAFAASEPGVSFTCTLDAGAPVACTSPHLVTVAAGAHQMRIDAVDAAGNADASPVLHSWTVDAGTPPPSASCATPGTTTVVAAADSWISQSSSGSNFGSDSTLKVRAKTSDNARALVQFALPAIPAGCAVTDAKLLVHASSPVPGRTIQARQLTSTWAESTVRWTTTLNTTGTPATRLTVGTAGYLEWQVRDMVASMYTTTNRGFLLRDATEGGGGVEQSFSARNSSNPPRLAITFGQAADTVAPNTMIDAGPPAETTSTATTVAFSATEAGSFGCVLDGAPYTPCASPVNLTGLAAGSHTFAVTATDAAGNVDATPASVTWTVLAGEPPAQQVAAGPSPTSPPPSTSTTTTTPPPSTSSSNPVQPPATSSPTTTTATPPPTSSSNPVQPPATSSPSTTTTTQPSCSAGTVTLTASADSWVVEKDPAKNNGSDATLKVTTKPGENTRALVRFNVPQVPLGCSIVAAELRMENSSPKSGHTLQALQAAGAWTEGSVTWANQPGTTGAAATAVTPQNAGRMVWNVLDQVRSMASGTNNGFVVRDAAEGGNGDEQAFHGREKAPDRPPQLVITFG